MEVAFAGLHLYYRDFRLLSETSQLEFQLRYPSSLFWGLNKQPQTLGTPTRHLPSLGALDPADCSFALPGGQRSAAVRGNRQPPFPPAGAEQGRHLSRALGWILLTRCFCKAQPHLCWPIPAWGPPASHLPANSVSPVGRGAVSDNLWGQGDLGRGGVETRQCFWHFHLVPPLYWSLAAAVGTGRWWSPRS